MATLEDLIQLADEGEASDFQRAVDEILAAKTVDAVEAIAGAYEFGPNSDEDVREEANDEISDDELELILDTITEEEFEQLDELSKKTLADYIHRSAWDLVDRGKKDVEINHQRQRLGDATSAISNSRNAKLRQAADNAVYDLKRDSDKEQDQNRNKILRRRIGVGKAARKLAKEEADLQEFTDEELKSIVENITEEEFEQLDELSKKTLVSYMHRASSDIARKAGESDRWRRDASDIAWKGGMVPHEASRKISDVSDSLKKAADDNDSKAHKRKYGMYRAGKRLEK